MLKILCYIFPLVILLQVNNIQPAFSESCLDCDDFDRAPNVSNKDKSKRVLRTLSLSKLLNLKVDALSFFDSTLKKAPSNTIIVTNDYWVNLGMRSLEDIIDGIVPGMQISEHYWMGPLISVRGLAVNDNAKTLVLVDNIPIGMRRLYGSNKELAMPLLGDLERTEVIHGPNSLIHGGGAINGVINMVTKRGKDHQGGYIQVEYSPITQAKSFQGSYGLKYGSRKDLFIYAGVYQADGYDPEDLWWNKNELGTVRSLGISTRVQRYEPTVKASINWHHDGFWLRTHFFRILGSTNSPLASLLFHRWYANRNMSRPSSHYDWYRALLSLNAGKTIQLNLHNKITLSATTQLHDFALHETDAPSSSNPYITGGNESYFRTEVLWRNTSLKNNSLALGIWVAFRNFEDRKTFFSKDTVDDFGGANTPWWDFSLFFESVYELGKKFTLSFGTRLGQTILTETTLSKLIPQWAQRITGVQYDGAGELDMDGLSFSPRIALSYAATHNNILKISYARAFRLPDGGQFASVALNNYIYNTGIEFDLDDPNLGSSLIELSPETVDSIELNSINTFLNESVSLHLSFYGNMYSNTLVSKSITHFNLPVHFFSVGTELSLSASIPIIHKSIGHANMRASYGYSRPLEFNVTAYSSMPGLVNGVSPEASHDAWTAYSPHQIKLSSTLIFLEELMTIGFNFRLYSGVDTSGEPFNLEDDRSIMHRVFGRTTAITDVSFALYPGRWGIRISAQNIFANKIPPPSLFAASFGPASSEAGLEAQLIHLSIETRL